MQVSPVLLALGAVILLQTSKNLSTASIKSFCSPLLTDRINLSTQPLPTHYTPWLDQKKLQRISTAC
jgi:hypothetical protein